MENKPNKNRFERAVDVLVKAYVEDNLQPGKACKCFIGNMMNQTHGWHKRLLAYREHKITSVTLWAGYSMRELDIIEHTFETEATEIMINYILNSDIILPNVKENLKFKIESESYDSEDIRIQCYFIFEASGIDRFSLDYWEAVEKTFDLLVILEGAKNQKSCEEYLAKAVAKKDFYKKYDVALKELAK